MTSGTSDALLTYLDDHLGGSETATAMIDRFASHCAGQPLGDLCLGITGKRSLWRALAVARSPNAASGLDLGALIRRAEDQLERVQTERLRASARAL